MILIDIRIFIEIDRNSLILGNSEKELEANDQ